MEDAYEAYFKTMTEQNSRIISLLETIEKHLQPRGYDGIKLSDADIITWQNHGKPESLIKSVEYKTENSAHQQDSVGKDGMND